MFRSTSEEHTPLNADNKECKNDSKEYCSKKSEFHLKEWRTRVGRSKRSTHVIKVINDDNKVKCINRNSELGATEED